MNNQGKKSAPAGDRRGRDGGRRYDIFPTPHANCTTNNAESQEFSRLLDQAVAEAERCAALAKRYGRLAEKHGRIKAELERLLILSEPIILEGAGALADYAEVLAEEVWGDD